MNAVFLRSFTFCERLIVDGIQPTCIYIIELKNDVIILLECCRTLLFLTEKRLS